MFLQQLAPFSSSVGTSRQQLQLYIYAQVDSSDYVVEIGSSFGVCTHILAQHAGRVLGIEVSPSLVQESRKRYPGLEFVELDVFNAMDRLAVLAEGCSTLFVDIGGNREAEALVNALPPLLRLLRPGLMVVKSRELAKAAKAELQRQAAATAAAAATRAAAPVAAAADASAPAAAPPAVTSGNAGTETVGQQAPASCSSIRSAGRTGAPLHAAAADEPQPRQFEGCLADGAGWWERFRSEVLIQAAALGTADAAGAPPTASVPSLEKWFVTARAEGFTRNPLRHPARQTADGTPICRLFNYTHCKAGDQCRYSHTACHYCGVAGHIARHCPAGLEQESQQRVL